MLLSVVFVGAFGSAIIIGLRDAYLTLNDEIWNLVEECGYPDLYIETVPEIKTSFLEYLPSDLQEKLDIQKIEYRASYNTTFIYNNDSYSCRVFSYDEEGLLKHHLMDGSFSNDELRMEYYFADANKLAVGNEISIKMHNGEEISKKITSTFVSAESSIVKADPYSISSSRDFAYLFLPKDEFYKYAKEEYFNEILINFIGGKELDVKGLFNRIDEIVEEEGSPIAKEIVAQLEDNIAYITTYEDSEVIHQFKAAIKAVDMISSAVPLGFFIIVLIVTSLFLFQIVRQCRKDIGILRALGEKKRDITLIFVLLAVAIAFVSWLIGLGIGLGINTVANYAYGTALKLYPLQINTNFGVVMIALGAMVFVCVLTSLLASVSIAKVKPVEAMKALPPMNNKTPYLVRTTFKNSPITLKIAISQTLRNLRRYILSGICLLASGMMIFLALSINLSKNTTMEQLYEVRMNYDVQVYFDNLPSDKDIETYFKDDDNIIDKTLIKYLPSKISFNGVDENVLINGIDNDQDLVRIVTDYNNVISVPDEGIVLSYAHAHAINADVGDIILVNGEEAEVKAISHEYLYQVSYMSFANAHSKNERGSLLAKVHDEDAFFEQYKDLKHVTYISFNDVITQEYNDRLLAFSISSYILNAVSIILGFTIVFNMMQTNLKEQKRTFSTIRTLGYQRSAISTSNLFMSLIQYIFAMAFAIPLGVLFSSLILNGISIPEQTFPFPHSWVMYVLSVVFVLFFLLISHFIAMSSMKKWNLAECVKERE